MLIVIKDSVYAKSFSFNQLYFQVLYVIQHFVFKGFVSTSTALFCIGSKGSVPSSPVIILQIILSI